MNPNCRSLSAILLTMSITLGFHDADADVPRTSQGRSMTISAGGVVAAEHPLAAQAGADMLSRGGNAIDAAVAANAAMGVLSPMMCGIGGDLFAIVYHAASDRLIGLNASGWSPKALDLKRLKEDGHESVPLRHIHAVTVPGCVDGWAKLLSEYGALTMAEVLAPSIAMAESGFPVAEWIGNYWSGSVGLLKRQPEAAQALLLDGRAPKTGELFRNPDMAWSYRQLALHGRDAFYRGAIADRILALQKERGGAMALDDLADFEAEWVAPIATEYRGWTLYEIPPNGQGVAALMMLNLMEPFPLADYGHNSAAALHAMIEAKKLAYADMLRFVADMRFGNPPLEAMLDKSRASVRAGLIDPRQAHCEQRPSLDIDPGPDTTYLCAVDKDGNMVSLIQSVYYGFGSGLVAPGTGFALQNRGALFSADPKHPNVLEGRKRPLHTIIPGFLAKGEVKAAFGIMGGWNQSQAHAQFVSNIVDHGMNIQAAMEAPRFSKRDFEGCGVSVEARIPDEIRRALTEMGHELDLRGDFSSTMGGGQAVMRDFAAGVNYGASDPRKDGAAIPEPVWRREGRP